MNPAVFTGGRAGPLTLVEPPGGRRLHRGLHRGDLLTAGFAGVGLGAGFAGAGVVGVGVVGVGVVGVGVVGVGVVAQVDRVIVSVSSVSAPAPFACAPASSRPAIVTLFCTEMSVCARTVPTNVEPVFRVVELPTCQKTLQA